MRIGGTDHGKQSPYRRRGAGVGAVRDGLGLRADPGRRRRRRRLRRRQARRHAASLGRPPGAGFFSRFSLGWTSMNMEAHPTAEAHDPVGKKIGLQAALLAVFLSAFTILAHRAHTETIMAG